MDPITHAASGAVAMLAMPHRPASRWAVPLAALAAALPDVDVALAHSPLQFLLLHRGITHSLAFAPLLGLVMALAGYALWNPRTEGRWPFARTWIFMTAMMLLHIWLDCITTYGTMILLPFSHLRVRLNAVFIIDLLLTLPLLWAVWRWRARRGLMLLAAAWMFVYPGLSIGLNAWHEVQTRERLTAEGRAPRNLVVLPDAFAPFFWRALYTLETASGPQVHSQGLTALGTPYGPETANAALSGGIAHNLARQSVVAEAFLQFTLLPVVTPLPQNMRPEVQPEDAPTAGLLVYDLRFGSSLPFVRRLMALRPSADIPFKYMAELAEAPPEDTGEPAAAEDAPESLDAAAPAFAASPAFSQRLLRERMRFSDSRRDSLWHAPRPPTPPSLLQWLVGLR